MNSILIHAQNLQYESNGRIVDDMKNKLSVNQVKALLSDNKELLKNYTDARTKKDVGNVLLYGGLTILATDLSIGFFGPKVVDYPTGLTIVGALSMIIAVPVKIGYSKRIKKVVDDYNATNGVGYYNIEKLEFISDNSGVGLRLTIK